MDLPTDSRADSSDISKIIRAMVQERIVEVEDIVKVVGRGIILCLSIPYEEGDPEIGTNITSLRTGHEHKICFIEGSMTLMTVPRRKSHIGLGVEHAEEFRVSDKIKIFLNKKDK